MAQCELKHYMTLHYLGNIKLDRCFKDQFDYLPNKPILTNHLKFLLQKSDLTCGNFCTNITTPTDINNKSFYLDPQYINTLKDLHIDYLNLANYNLFNNKKQGFIDTLYYLNHLNIKYSGAGLNINDCKKSWCFQKKNFQIGFLSACTSHDYYSAGVPSCLFNEDKGHEGMFYIDLENEDYDDVLDLIKKEKEKYNILIFSIFWGQSYSHIVRHKKTSKKIKSVFIPEQHIVKFTHKAIDAGVDILIGIGDHILPIEYYKQGIIIYSLGNFIHSNFVNNKKYRHDLGAIVEIKININNPSDKILSIIPIKISSQYYYTEGKNIKTNRVQLAKKYDRMFIKNKMFLIKDLF